MAKKVLAICCSDLHLTLKAPPCRAGEPDWLKAQARVGHQLDLLGQAYHAPIIMAGDVFDHWNAPVELANWAAQFMPPIFAIPGQHDLPHHNLQDIKRSAYWSLVHARIIKPLYENTGAYRSHGVSMTAFPWGVEITPCANPSKQFANVAVIHRYVCTTGADYKGAPREAYINKKLCDQLAGYDVAIFGDNHKHFQASIKGGPLIWNCGAMQRLRSDQTDYRPCVGLLYDDCTIQPHYLDISEDVFEQTTEPDHYQAARDCDAMLLFLKELQHIGDNPLDFKAAVRRALRDNPQSAAVKQILLEAIGD